MTRSALASLLGALSLVFALSQGALGAAGPSVALYYGAQPPWDELAAFDAVVVDPGHVPDPRAAPLRHAELLAYLSVGEIHPGRPYFNQLPSPWRLGANTAWGSIVVDQSQPEWPAWFMEHAVRPLWRSGYRGFFLDTLDSFQLVAHDDASRARQQQGLERVVRAIKSEYPEAKLVFNRGFEILPQVHGLAWMVAAESLFRGWDAGASRYREVPAEDRAWLLGQLNRVKDEYHLPVLAIDYVPPGERQAARDTARRIGALGFIPWVANPSLDMLGVGAVEVMPRKVLMLYDGRDEQSGLVLSYIHRYATMPLNYFGYVAEYRDVRAPVPEHPLAGRYAGLVSWLLSDDGARDSNLPLLVGRAREEGVRIAVLGRLGLGRGELIRGTFGLSSAPMNSVPGRISIEKRDPLVGYEIAPMPDRRSFFPLVAEGGQPLLTLRSDAGQTMEAVAFTPWGGYALFPYALAVLPAFKGQRWVIDPFAFLSRALELPAMPAPDVTTENGRRLMMVHIDGDGFASRAEIPGTPFAGQALLDQVLLKQRIPTTVSVIQGEVGRNGLYPSDSAELERIARNIFALPHVEIASHSFSHPFRWRQLEKDEETESYSLAIPGYRFDAATEVDGSLEYINRTLAPAGKRAQVFLWTGDSNPGSALVARAYAQGVLNMNGGDTWITRAEPTVTLVSPLGIDKQGSYQVYAPNQNENVYTGLWTGPYYGYRRVIETFQMTDAPRRLKPIDLYFHVYSATKRASLASLDEAYRWALAQPVMNVHVSEYIRKVLDFNHLVIARDGDGWLVRGAGELRTLRLPAAAGFPDMLRSRGVAGFARVNDQHYLHLAGDEAYVRLADAAPREPYLAWSNARLVGFSADQALTLELSSELPKAFALGNGGACRARSAGRELTARDGGAGLREFRLEQDGRATITVRCGS